MKNRPRKKVYSSTKTELLRKKAINKILSLFLPNEKIIKICLIGSSVKNDFGKYEPPGFRNSLYSDFDFIIFVQDNYQIPDWLKREPSGKPFSCNDLNLAYRNKKFIDDTYDVEIFFIREKNMYIKEIQEEGELAGIPMTTASKNTHLVVFSIN
ncbi:MAG: hypothetical protein ABH827_06150 [bacterium]